MVETCQRLVLPNVRSDRQGNPEQDEYDWDNLARCSSNSGEISLWWGLGMVHFLTLQQ